MRGYDNKALFRTPVSFSKTCDVCHEEGFRCDTYGCWKLPDNSQAKPQYSLAVSYLIGAVILVCMGTGIYLGVRFGY